MKCKKHLYKKPKKGSAIKGFIASDDHSIHYRYTKNGDDRKNVIIIHGGPGSGISSEHPRYFNPEKYNVIQFDQRLCGQSTSNSKNILENVSLKHLVEDIESIRQTLKLGNITLFGISWGGTVALAYASFYSKFVDDITLLTPLIINKDSQEWIFKNVVTENPHLEEAFAKINNGCIASKVIDGENEEAMLDWLAWEASLAGVKPPTELKPMLKRRTMLCLHYFKRDTMINSGQLDRLLTSSLSSIKLKSLHGKHDIAVGSKTSSFLKNNIPNSEVIVVDNLGHAANTDHRWNKLVTDLTDSL